MRLDSVAMSATFEPWKRADEILQRALELTEPSRTAFVAEACGDDADLRELVGRLLIAGSGQSGPLRTGAAADPLGERNPSSVSEESRKFGGPTGPDQALEPGSRLGDYEIESVVGSGGMGIVYAARDHRLERLVAVKVLSPRLASDPASMARFRREARMLAAVSHPGIAEIHGVEEIDRVSFLVMELVDGVPLSTAFRRGPMLPTRAVEFALQVASALEAAHDQGIVHRDLKPGNVMLHRGTQIKLIDFGLARLYRQEEGSKPGVRVTDTGILIGTAPYMSPEQLRCEEADHRADVWSFGCLLFEMLAGQRPFDGETPADTMSAILEASPNFGSLPAGLPESLRQLIRRCLEPDKTRRLQHLGEARIALQESNTAAVVASAAQPAADRQDMPTLVRKLAARPGWAVVSAATIVILTAVAAWGGLGDAPLGPPDHARYLEVPLPAGIQLSEQAVGVLALSNDGRTLAYIGRAGADNTAYLLHLDGAGPAQKIPDSAGAQNLVFSPDGQSVAYFSRGQLLSYSIARDTTTLIADANGRKGVAWGTRAQIYFTAAHRTALSRVPATGGAVAAATKLDVARLEDSHRHPTVLPNGVVLYTVRRTDADDEIWAWDPATDDRRLLVQGRVPRLVGGRFLVFRRTRSADTGSLLAVAFDIDRLELMGSPVVAAEGIGAYAVADDGTLAYAPVRSRATSLVLVDRDGGERLITDEVAYFDNPRFSPDGSRISVSKKTGGDSDVWVYDVDSGAGYQLASEERPGRYQQDPVWGPDGDEIYYIGERGILAIAASGGAGPRLVVELAEDIQLHAWTPLGLMYTRVQRVTDGDIFLVSEAGVVTEFSARPTTEWAAALSPDERWVAWAILEDGPVEIFVTSVNGEGPRWQVSEAGGIHPSWSADGSELFYGTDAGVMSVEVKPGQTFMHGPPRRVVDLPWAEQLPRLMRVYDVHPDGRQLVVVRTQTPSERRLVVVVDWVAELDRLTGR